MDCHSNARHFVSSIVGVNCCLSRVGQKLRIDLLLNAKRKHDDKQHVRETHPGTCNRYIRLNMYTNHEWCLQIFNLRRFLAARTNPPDGHWMTKCSKLNETNGSNCDVHSSHNYMVNSVYLSTYCVLRVLHAYAALSIFESRRLLFLSPDSTQYIFSLCYDYERNRSFRKWN